MRSRLIARLGALGVPPSEDDFPVLDALCAGASRRLLAETMQPELPQELEDTALNMAAGEYLFFRKHTGSLDSLQEDAVVRQISQGDTSITYAVGEALSPLDALIQRLCTPQPALLLKWRRLPW